MDIEKEIFKRRVIQFDKLIPYGFRLEDDRYVYSLNILNDAFRVEVIITDKEVVGKVFDLAFDEEYTNYRIKNQNGEFTNKVKNEFENILKDIRDKCTLEKYFVSEQANRITDLIIAKYNNKPEFLWENSSGHGVFRNEKTNKWYGIIMNINKNKIDKEDLEVEVLNVKLDENKIIELLKRKGFYKAYHMNKKYWITILLDNTVSDKEIMGLIGDSHKFTE